jgi:diguanylate cyclase (GGDEF)-like protein
MGLLAFRPSKARWLARLAAMAFAAQRLGITARMIISFAAVALLAGTANMIARESVHIIRTVTHAPEIRVVSGPAPVQRLNQLGSALQRFREGVRQRIDASTADNAAQYGAAKRTLQTAILALKRGATDRELDAATRAGGYIDKAEEVLFLADQRRQARSGYGLHMRSAAGRIGESLDSAWTVFGRVIARKSLLQLRAELDAIRAPSEALISGETLGRQELALLTTAESKFADTLNAYQVNLRKSEGDAWFDAVSADSAALVKAREFLSGSNARFTESRRAFQELGSKLEGLALFPVGAAKPPATADALAAPAADAVVETTVERNDPAAARVMAIVTALVMLIIVAISVFTVRSIVIPVRRLVRATRQLADGRSSVRVGRGGIKELDAVAQAFDQMAEQLETMRGDYRRQQENLEHQVTERTYKLQSLAYQDPLTSLPNRRHLFSLLGAASNRAHDAGRHVGVFFLDIDNFKNINDSLGHVFGDRVLMSVANRLEEVIDSVGFAARWGGDEFTLVYESANSPRELQDFGAALTAAFDKSLTVDDREISISVSIRHTKRNRKPCCALPIPLYSVPKNSAAISWWFLHRNSSPVRKPVLQLSKDCAWRSNAASSSWLISRRFILPVAR